MWDIEDLRDVNKDPQQVRSVVDGLLDVGAAWPELLGEVSDQLDEADEPLVAVFCQLPFVVPVPPVEFSLEGVSRGLLVSLWFRPFRLRVNRQCKPIVENDAELSECNATQVVAIVPYWGRRRELYDKYMDCFTRHGFKNRTILPPHSNWIGTGNRAMSAIDFEFDIGRRLMREMKTVLRDFVPALEIVSGRPVEWSGWFDAYFTMPAPGRVSVGELTPLLARFVELTPRSNQKVIKRDALLTALKVRFRKLGEFEQGLVQSQQLLDRGQVASSLQATISLLEIWLKGQLPKKKRRGFFDCISDPLVSSVAPKELLDRLLRAKDVRNEFTHETTQKKSDDHPKNMGEAEVAADAIDASFQLYRLINRARSTGTFGKQA